jgi:F-type H+-transporting ATPase subunit epsilon
MAGTLTLRVITPDKIALDQSVASARIPGLDGSIGILPRHAPMIAALDSGLLHYREQAGGQETVLFVAGGFAEVRDDTLRLVTQAGEKPEEIDEERAREAEKRARERISAGKTEEGEPIDLLRAEAALRRAVMRLRAREYGSA